MGKPVFARCATMGKLSNVAKKHSLTGTRRIRLPVLIQGVSLAFVMALDSVEPNRCSIKTRFPCILLLFPLPIFLPLHLYYLSHPSFLPSFHLPTFSLPPILFSLLPPSFSLSCTPSCSPSFLLSLLPSFSHRESEHLTLSSGRVEDELGKGLGLRGTRYH